MGPEGCCCGPTSPDGGAVGLPLPSGFFAPAGISGGGFFEALGTSRASRKRDTSVSSGSSPISVLDVLGGGGLGFPGGGSLGPTEGGEALTEAAFACSLAFAGPSGTGGGGFLIATGGTYGESQLPGTHALRGHGRSSCPGRAFGTKGGPAFAGAGVGLASKLGIGSQPSSPASYARSARSS